LLNTLLTAKCGETIFLYDLSNVAAFVAVAGLNRSSKWSFILLTPIPAVIDSSRGIANVHSVNKELVEETVTVFEVGALITR
jgi:hypothetical protein